MLPARTKHATKRVVSALQQPRHCLTPFSSLSSLRHRLTGRRLPLFYDYLTPQQSHLLNLSLDAFVASPQRPSSGRDHASAVTLPSVLKPTPMPVGHHLVYFPPQVPSSQLLPDGTDKLHFSGSPFNRRMWAGGWVRFYDEGGPLLNGQRAVCMEGIRDVSVKGKEGEEKIFVGVERRVAVVGEGEEDEHVRARVWTENEDERGDAIVVERRNLVFMRDRTSEEIELAREASAVPRKAARAPANPEFSHTLIPSRSLLFRYSALTFNAHSIHLNPGYAQNVEGYHDVLVHGPLTLTLMLTVIQNHLSDIGQIVRGIEYRNLAPLFVEQQMRICAKPKGSGAGAWDIWVEGGDGGLAVKGTIQAENLKA
ncbi:hypothetical protein FQN55_004090 [Onygenales sp. PD_40]|nr:hypothetical protein FQN55_004090 [Onygenales sp. PD_40]